jgi:hypothetical protein
VDRSQDGRPRRPEETPQRGRHGQRAAATHGRHAPPPRALRESTEDQKIRKIERVGEREEPNLVTDVRSPQSFLIFVIFLFLSSPSPGSLAENLPARLDSGERKS